MQILIFCKTCVIMVITSSQDPKSKTKAQPMKAFKQSEEKLFAFGCNKWIGGFKNA